MLHRSIALELAQIAKEGGALVRRGQLRYPSSETGECEIGFECISGIT